MSTNDTIQGQQAADVVIVGGGVIGLLIARGLIQRGVSDVMLIERGGLGREASFAAGGILAPQAEADSADEFFQLACLSRDLYPALAGELLAETGIDIELDATGTLYLGFTATDEEEIEKRYEWQSAAGLSVDRLSPSEARRLEPGIAANLRAALLFSKDIQVDNRRLLMALIAANKKSGVRLVTDTEVVSLITDEECVTGVQTSSGGYVSTCRVVLAAGAWSSLIPTLVGQQYQTRIQVGPMRGQMLCFQTTPRLSRHVLYSPRGYLVPRLDGRVLAGSTSEQAGFVKQVTAAGVHSILSHAFELAPALCSLEILSSWSGFRPHTEDDLPLLGQGRYEGLFYATGHYRNGILLAPITAQLIAEAVLGNVSPLLSPFAPERFCLVDAH